MLCISSNLPRYYFSQRQATLVKDRKRYHKIIIVKKMIGTTNFSKSHEPYFFWGEGGWRRGGRKEKWRIS